MDFHQCRICKSKELEHIGSVPEYTSGPQCFVARCESCGVRYTNIDSVDVEIYNLIYKNPENIPGYARYKHYSEKAKVVRDPISWLSKQEDVYWGIQQALSLNNSNFSANELTVIDYGSGLGYLSFALKTKGYSVFGIDISQSAVELANSNYGDIFQQGDSTDCNKRFHNGVDVVICAEVIEHVEDPKKLISDLLGCLKKSGKLIITTPNADAYQPTTVWVSDLPPVHLWLFSEKTILAIGKELGCSVKFVDFSLLNYQRYLPWRKGGLVAPDCSSIIDKKGNPVYVQTKSLLERLGIKRGSLSHNIISFIRNILNPYGYHQRKSTVMVAILERL